jgi:hypothetical protein
LLRIKKELADWRDRERAKRDNGLGHCSFFLKSLEQKLLKSPLALRCNLVNRAFASARNLCLAFGAISPDLTSCRTAQIEGADIDVGVALDQSVFEPPFNFVGVEVTAMKHPEDLDRRGVGAKIMADLRL